MSDERGCCAHLIVEWETKDNADGSTTGWWECRDCGVKFVPEPLAKYMASAANQRAEAAERLNLRWGRAFDRWACGSEFYNDPERVAKRMDEMVSGKIELHREVAAARQQLAAARAALTRVKPVMRWNESISMMTWSRPSDQKAADIIDKTLAAIAPAAEAKGEQHAENCNVNRIGAPRGAGDCNCHVVRGERHDA